MSTERDEVERIKREMRRTESTKRAAGIVEAWLGTPENRRTAREELEADRANRGTPSPPTLSGGDPAPPSSRRPGPAPLTDLATVEATRAGLRKAGDPSGERSIAKALGVSRDAVRYALGKDRRGR